MRTAKIEKIIQDFIASGYEVLKVYDDWSVGYFFNTTDQSEAEFKGEIQPVLVITMRELEEYKEHYYHMKWDEVPGYYAQDLENDGDLEKFPYCTPEDSEKIERTVLDWVRDITEPFEGKWAVLWNDGAIEFEQLPTASDWDKTGWTEIGEIEGLGLDGIRIEVVDPCSGKKILDEQGFFNLVLPEDKEGDGF